MTSRFEGEDILQALKVNVSGSPSSTKGTVCFICGKLGHDDKHCPTSTNWQNAVCQYGDWLRAGWIAKEVTKEKVASSGSREGFEASNEWETGGKFCHVTGETCLPTSESSWDFENADGNPSLGKGEVCGVSNSTCVTRHQSAENWAKSDSSEQAMRILEPGAKSCAQLSAPIVDVTKGPKGFLSQKGPIQQAKMNISKEQAIQPLMELIYKPRSKMNISKLRVRAAGRN